MYRTCIECRIEKPKNDFRNTKGYRQRTCKECLRSICISDNCQNKSRRNEKCSECYRKQPRLERKIGLNISGWLRQCLNSTKRLQKYRNLRNLKTANNDLTIEFLLELYNKQNGKCYISGIDLETKYNNVCSISIDRIDNNLGYLKENVILTCQWVNMGRSRCSISEFRAILAKLNNN
jgi:hypothetical protein